MNRLCSRRWTEVKRKERGGKREPPHSSPLCHFTFSQFHPVRACSQASGLLLLKTLKHTGVAKITRSLFRAWDKSDLVFPCPQSLPEKYGQFPTRGSWRPKHDNIYKRRPFPVLPAPSSVNPERSKKTFVANMSQMAESERTEEHRKCCFSNRLYNR